MIYFLNSVMVALLAITDFSSQKKKQGNILFFVVTVFLILFCSLRNQVGLDDANYTSYFDSTNSIENVIFRGDTISSDETEMVEPLFLLLASFGKAFSNDVFILFFFSALIVLLIRFKVFVKYSPYPLLSCLIYVSHEYYVKDWSQIRAGIASAIILYGITFLMSGQKKKYSLIVLLAAGFHLTALLAVPLLFLDKFLERSRDYVRLLVVALVVSLFLPFKTLLIQLSNYGLIPERVTQYFFYEKYSYELAITNMVILKTLLISILGIFFFEKLNRRYSYFKMVLTFQILGASYLLVFRDFAILAVRANGLLYAVEPILIILILSLLRQKAVIFVIVIIYSFLWVYYDQFINPNGILPYKSIL